MAVFLENSFDCGVFGEHLLVVAPALLGIFCQDVVVHQYMHLDFLFLFYRQVKKRTFFDEEIYVLFVLSEGPVIRVIGIYILEGPFVPLFLTLILNFLLLEGWTDCSELKHDPIGLQSQQKHSFALDSIVLKIL